MSSPSDNRGLKDRAASFRRFKVSQLRTEDRDEVLVVMMESREGAHFMWITPILRDGDTVKLGETLAFPEQSGGRFAGLFEP